MSKKVTQEAFAYLDEQHAYYCDSHQKEESDSRRMAETGHPYAVDYLKLRSFFDELKYAANSSARYYSFKNSAECSTYWAPTLTLSWTPTGEQFHEFRHIFRADPAWDRYVEAVAAAGYPPETGPRFESGSWYIHTQFLELVDILTAMADAEKIPKVHSRLAPMDGKTSYCVDIGMPFGKQVAAMHNRVVAAINKFHKGYILPKRTPELTAEDNAPLPLQEKKFAMGNVEKVTVTDRHVLVPLIPAGPATELLENAVNDIITLLNQGYPFEQVSNWLESFLKPGYFKQLQDDYAVTA